MFGTICWLDSAKGKVGFSKVEDLEERTEGVFAFPGREAPTFTRAGWSKFSIVTPPEQQSSSPVLDSLDAVIYYLAKDKDEVSAFRLGLSMGAASQRGLDLNVLRARFGDN